MAKSRPRNPARNGVKDAKPPPAGAPTAPAAAARPGGDAPDPVAFPAVREAERRAIAGRLPRPSSDAGKTERNWTGLCLSGGGIRSACFSLGVLEGLDRLPYEPDGKVEGGGGEGRRNHLEFFDYVSSVSGGSCAAGHLATAMLPTTDEPQWLGAVPLASKTVPGWLWGLGVWFLGAVFQLLKTGSLLVGLLALVALCMRVLDAPDAAFFCSALGSDSDIQRGFAPFWVTLWIFLVGYGAYVWKKDGWAVGWFAYAGVLLFAYLAVVSWTHDDDPTDRWWLPFWFHYGALALLVLPALSICAGLMTWRGLVRLTGLLPRRYALRLGLWRARLGRRIGARAARLAVRLRLATGADGAAGGPAKARADRAAFQLRAALLGPLLVGMFCFAGLVTTGDIEFSRPGDELAQILATQDKSQKYSEVGSWIYSAAWVALGLASLGFVFPRKLFQSARLVEARNEAGGPREASWFRSRGWEPVFRVVVFLCSYGVVLLVLFLVFSTVAKENVSGYYDWRGSLPSASFHFTDFRDPELAWGQIAHDAATPWIHEPAPGAKAGASPGEKGAPQGKMKPNPWTPLARRLIEARARAGVPLNKERRERADLELLGSLPWIDRALGPLAWLWPMTSWSKDGYDVQPSSHRHYELLARRNKDQRMVALRLADSVLSDPGLYKFFPHEAVDPESYVQRKLKVKWDPARYEGLERRYRERARVLEAAASGRPAAEQHAALQAAVRNNNRYALSLYLPVIMRDRRDHVVFSSIVWTEDQWTRSRIAVVALVVWLLCCAVDVNTFSLHAFYRAHVIGGWVKVPPGKASRRWLYETGPTYRGHEFGEHGRSRPVRRAPLMIFNATLEGNRWLGEEPELPLNVFGFSPLASGSGVTGYWRSRERTDGEAGRPVMKQEFARRNHLDIGQIVAISGAFLSPGTVANPALSAVLHLLNIQTGSWVRDPRRFERRGAWEDLKFHLGQSLGVDVEKDSRYMLTDGAHVENLGLYGLLQRRCTLIVASDCSQEDRSEKAAGRRFDALVQVLQQASVDGVEVGPFLSSRALWLKPGESPGEDETRPSCRRTRSTGLGLVLPGGPDGGDDKDGPETPKPPGDAARPASPGDPKLSPAGRDEVAAGLKLSREHYVFARIAYPEGGRGLLVYLRPTLTGDEGDALLHGAADGAFPDDDPMDQFYSPSKMNTYRLLGRHIAVELMHDPVMKRVLRRLVEGRPVGTPPPDEEPTCQEYCGASGPTCLERVPRPFRFGDAADVRR